MKILYFESSETYKKIMKESIKEIREKVNFRIDLKLMSGSYDAILDYTKKARNRYDCHVYFLEAELVRELDGIDLAKSIRKFDPLAYIIFLSDKDYSILACNYSIKAFDYLMKPVKVEEIYLDLVSINKDYEARNEILNKEKREIITLITNYKKIKINIKNIILIEYKRPRVIIYTKYETYTVYSTLKNIEEILSDASYDNCFFRAHSGYIVNLAEALSINITERSIFLSNGMCIPIARSRRQSLKTSIELSDNSGIIDSLILGKSLITSAI